MEIAQLHELAQRNYLSPPTYSCIREGPDHTPRFKAAVTYNGTTFESPDFCSKYKKARTAAAKVALNVLLQSSTQRPGQTVFTEVNPNGMHKSQLQELAQKGRFDLPTYSYIREGLHSSRFKATVLFNGEIFESPVFCATLRQAEHVAATVALQSLSEKGCLPDDCGVYKNLLQEMALKGRLPQPVYSVSNSGQLHEPVFTSTVEVAREVFSGAPAKTRKQAEKNAAMVAWSALKQPGSQSSLTSWASDKGGPTDHELTVIEYVQANNNTKELDVQSVSLASTRLGGLSLQEPPASKTSDKRTDKDLEQIMMATVRASRHVTLNNIIINHLLHSFLQVQRSEFFPVKRLQYWPGMPMLYHLATWHGWQWK